MRTKLALDVVNATLACFTRPALNTASRPRASCDVRSVLSLLSLTAAISCNRIAFAAAYFSSDGGYHFYSGLYLQDITGFVVVDDWFLAMVVAIQVAVSRPEGSRELAR